MSSLRRRDGEMETAHFGPGVPGLYAAGKTIREATLSCRHCPTCVLIREDRVRERAYCRTCDAYICDICKAATLLSGYVHRTRDDLANLVTSGKYQLHGSLSNPILIPVLKET